MFGRKQIHYLVLVSGFVLFLVGVPTLGNEQTIFWCFLVCGLLVCVNYFLVWLRWPTTLGFVSYKYDDQETKMTSIRYFVNGESYWGKSSSIGWIKVGRTVDVHYSLTRPNWNIIVSPGAVGLGLFMVLIGAIGVSGWLDGYLP